jgi:hypothetical protein
LDRYNQARKLVKDKVYQAYGGYRCNCCGETERCFLTMDHIENDGAFMRKHVHGDGAHTLYLWLRKNNYPAGFQILCWNCQWGKRTHGICPHQLVKTSEQLPQY